MQSTPYVDVGDSWKMDLNPIFDQRHHTMFWNKVGDPYVVNGFRGEWRFQKAEDAIFVAKQYGWNYEVLYEGLRYHTLKSYADNFLFKKEEVSDVEEDDIDFKRI